MPVDWLEKLGMPECGECFAENKIDLSVLPHLTDQNLKDLGVPLGHRRKMLEAIGELAGAVQRKPCTGRQCGAEASGRCRAPLSHGDVLGPRGSTALSARMDPEDLREVIDTCGRRKGLLVDHVCDTPVVRANEDDGVIAFLYEKRVGTSLRHLGRHFGRQRVKLNVRWHRVADRLWGILPRLRQFQVLYVLFDNESLLLGQIDGARLGGDRRLIRVLRPQDLSRRREGYAERERGGDQRGLSDIAARRTPSFNPMSAEAEILPSTPLKLSSK